MTDRFPSVGANKNSIHITCISRVSFTKYFLTHPHRELDLAKREGWTCPNPGCNVHYAKKGKYIVSSWQVDGNSKVLDSCIICVLSSHFKKRENINLA